jgi:hypothetical protein
MEDDVSRVRAEALTLDATAARLRVLVSRFRLARGDRLVPIAKSESPAVV